MALPLPFSPPCIYICIRLGLCLCRSLTHLEVLVSQGSVPSRTWLLKATLPKRHCLNDPSPSCPPSQPVSGEAGEAGSLRKQSGPGHPGTQGPCAAGVPLHPSGVMLLDPTVSGRPCLSARRAALSLKKGGSGLKGAFQHLQESLGPKLVTPSCRLLVYLLSSQTHSLPTRPDPPGPPTGLQIKLGLQKATHVGPLPLGSQQLNNKHRPLGTSLLGRPGEERGVSHRSFLGLQVLFSSFLFILVFAPKSGVSRVSYHQ